ncbi:MAG: hypothetical protein AB1742_03250 [bacterium]
MQKKKLSCAEMDQGEEYHAEFSIPDEKINEYYELFARDRLSYVPPFLIMLYSFRPLAESFSLQPGTIHAAQSFEMRSTTDKNHFRAKAVVSGKYEKRGRKYIVIGLEIFSSEGETVALSSFGFVVPN